MIRTLPLFTENNFFAGQEFPYYLILKYLPRMRNCDTIWSQGGGNSVIPNVLIINNLVNNGEDTSLERLLYVHDSAGAGLIIRCRQMIATID